MELKSAGVVQAMLPVISMQSHVPSCISSADGGLGNAVRGVLMDPTDDWKAITRQLRMYATGCKTRDVLVMDEGVGIYFRFPTDPSNHSDHHGYLYASTELGPSFDGELRLSLRELVVFTLFAAFDNHHVTLHDFAVPPSPILIGPNTRPYRNVLPSPPDNKKRHRSAQPRRQAPKRGRQSDPADSSPQESFNRMVVGTTLTLELIPGKTPALTGRDRASSFDSGFYDDGTQSTPKSCASSITPSLITPPGARDQIHTATVTVERILKKNVAVVTDGKTHFIAKLFPPHTTTDPDRLLNKELAVYRQCATIQGSYIPYLYGVYRAVKRTPYFSSPILLTEYIGTGRTVADLVYLAGELDDDERADAEDELAALRAGARNAVETLHALMVVHADLSARNMVVVGKGHVVLVDFGYSLVLKDEPRRFKVRREDDLKQLVKAFEVGDCY